MKVQVASAVFVISMIESVIASGNGHHGSVTDLIAPAVNVTILVGFLVWKLKTPLTNFFNKKSEEVSNTLERANLKSKEAQMMHENEKRKLSNLPNEVKQIHQLAESDIAHFEKIYSKEIEDKSHKLKSDANLKINADKKQLINELNTQLLDQVITNAKSTIKKNKDFQEKASTKLLKGLQ